MSSINRLFFNDYLATVAGYSSYSLSGINRGAYFYSGQTQTAIDYYSNGVKSYIITQVSSGIPVIVGICNSSFTSHHAAVAYAYDQTTGKIYTNMGWGYGSSARLLPSNNGYCYFKSALTFTPTGSHVHSNNYVFRSSFGEQCNYYTCGCSYTFHVHDYSFSFVSMNNAKHKAFCSCGNKQIQPQSLIDGVCVCGYELKSAIIMLRRR